MEIMMHIIVVTGGFTLGYLIGYGLMALFDSIMALFDSIGKRWYYEYLYSRSLWCIWYGVNIY